MPAAAGGRQVKAGTITWAMQPGTAPNWIFPVVPAANNSVFNNFTFIWEMWRPLYWTVNGTVPEIEPNMSIANPPVYSNGNKTVTISLKSNYKWSNGQPITANDLLFYHRPDQGRASRSRRRTGRATCPATSRTTW